MRGVGWEDDDAAEEIEGEKPPNTIEENSKKEEIEFDSQDEDECEDLFSGIWSPQLARRRRKNKSFGRSD